MPGKPDKPHRIRIRTLDGKPRDAKELNKLRSQQLGAHFDIHGVGVEFILCASVAKHIEQVRTKLGGAGLEEIEGGDTTIAESGTCAPTERRTREGSSKHRGAPQQRGGAGDARGGQSLTPETDKADLSKKPYGFVALPEQFTTAGPVWHDGTSSEGCLSGEIRFELETLTPMLVGWERGQVGDAKGDWPAPQNLDGIGPLANKKSVLCPLRAPWGTRPVILPGDSLKGFLRQELGALLGAPMERVAERSYSYRPNSMFATNARLIPRIARVPEGGVVMMTLDPSRKVRVPLRLELLPAGLRYDKRREHHQNYYRFDDADGLPYRGGQGAGEKLNSKRGLHQKLAVHPSTPTESVDVPEEARQGYLETIRHLTSPEHGHFSERHPDVPKTIQGDAARNRILDAAANEVFQPGDLIWVEWDKVRQCIVSLGWHYYYRWAYTDSVRRCGGGDERHGLFPLDEERAQDDAGAPKGLSRVRRLFGYTGDNEGSAGIGRDDYTQLMGRISVNAGLEVVEDGDTEEKRFLPPTFLKELGMPRPSAVEHYLQQPHHPEARPQDRAKLVTYGDAAGYDKPGELAGRKFYLDRKDTHSGAPWADSSQDNRKNERSTLALEASRPGRRFRFTLRFRDFDPFELAAILATLAPHQFREVLDGTHRDGYCSKLGYARPLGWGSVRIEAKALLLLTEATDKAKLDPVGDISDWFRQHHQPTPSQADWLAIHRHKHPDGGDYPRKDGEIHKFHTTLRAEHSRARRFPPEPTR